MPSQIASQGCAFLNWTKGIEKQFVPALNSVCKKVTHWGEELGEDILNVARRVMEDQQYLDLI